jgi:polysaccharide export outer membrane protein
VACHNPTLPPVILTPSRGGIIFSLLTNFFQRGIISLLFPHSGGFALLDESPPHSGGSAEGNEAIEAKRLTLALILALNIKMRYSKLYFMQGKISSVIKYMLPFLFIFLLLFACSSNKELIQSNTGTEPQQIPPIKISEYVLGFGDELEISVYRQDEMTRKLKILPDGKIHYPLVGEIEAQGISVTRLRDKIREGLLKYYVDPQVSVSVTTVGSQKYFVLGEVKRPGVFQLDRPKTVIEAISDAEGFTLDAKQSFVLLIRGGPSNPKPTYQVLDIEKIFKSVDMTQNLALQQGDIIYVPASEYANVERFFDRLWTIIPARVGFLTFSVKSK